MYMYIFIYMQADLTQLHTIPHAQRPPLAIGRWFAPWFNYKRVR